MKNNTEINRYMKYVWWWKRQGGAGQQLLRLVKIRNKKKRVRNEVLSLLRPNRLMVVVWSLAL